VSFAHCLANASHYNAEHVKTAFKNVLGQAGRVALSDSSHLPFAEDCGAIPWIRKFRLPHQQPGSTGMSRFFKLVSLVLLVLIGAEALSAQEAVAPPKASLARLLGVLVGFGAGQYYLGVDGTGFLVGDAIGAAGAGIGYAIFASSFVGIGRYRTSPHDTGLAILGGGTVVLLVSRIWELSDLFGRIERGRREGSVAQVQPVVNVRETSFEVGVSIRY
jgi:hypothetical protein